MARLDLYPAISDGDLAVVRSLVDRGANLATRYGDRSTPLHHAAEIADYWRGDRAQRLDIVKLLLEAGADPDAVNEDGDTPLDVAATEAVAKLLRPRTGSARLTAEEEGIAAALRSDLDALRTLTASMSGPSLAEREALGRRGASAKDRAAARTRSAHVAAAFKKVARWQWLSNMFASPEPHYSERHQFPRPRLLLREPSARELATASPCWVSTATGAACSSARSCTPGRGSSTRWSTVAPKPTS